MVAAFLPTPRSVHYCEKWDENYNYNYGAGGGFTRGLIQSQPNHDNFGLTYNGGGGASFSADPEAKFDHHYVEYGYCKIERIDE